MIRTSSWFPFLAAAALVAAAASPAAADATDDAIAKLRAGADCTNKKSAHKDWCMADWAKGKAAALKPGLMIGLSVAIEADTDVDTALSDDVTLVFLQIDKDGPQLSATLKDVEGSPGVTTRHVDTATADVRKRLVSKIHSVKLGKELRAVANGLKGRSTRALTKGATAWTWDTGRSKAEMRQVGKYWVIVETPEGDDVAGRVITLLTTDVK